MHRENYYQFIKDIVNTYGFYDCKYNFEENHITKIEGCITYNNPKLIFYFFLSKEKYFSIKLDMSTVIMFEAQFGFIKRNFFLLKYKDRLDKEIRKFKLKQIL